MPEREYHICTRCVMDATDPDITFDEKGVCNHCKLYDDRVRNEILFGEAREQRLNALVKEIKVSGKNKKYDCVIGVSGGVDSTFVAYKVKELGLRPLAVHLDNGWDSELSVKNIENTLRKLSIDLDTYVIDWEEFRDLQIAFLKASTPDSEIPSDHAILSSLAHTARKIGIGYMLHGGNIRTETHLPKAWSQGHTDWGYIKSIHKRFGKMKLKSYPHMNLWSYTGYKFTQHWLSILDYLDYSKKDAMEIIGKELGWKYYGGKHYESIYTRFYQGYILPKKFGYDKRRVHFSSLICSGEMTRDEALKELKNETYPVDLQKEDRTYVIKKFGLNDNEFEAIMNLPKKSYWDYPSYGKYYKSFLFKTAKPIYRALTGIQRLGR
jgi:N-acetyl sugar amidotransferase